MSLARLLEKFTAYIKAFCVVPLCERIRSSERASLLFYKMLTITHLTWYGLWNHFFLTFRFHSRVFVRRLYATGGGTPLNQPCRESKGSQRGPAGVGFGASCQLSDSWSPQCQTPSPLSPVCTLALWFQYLFYREKIWYFSHLFYSEGWVPSHDGVWDHTWRFLGFGTNRSFISWSLVCFNNPVITTKTVFLFHGNVNTKISNTLDFSHWASGDTLWNPDVSFCCESHFDTVRRAFARFPENWYMKTSRAGQPEDIFISH